MYSMTGNKARAIELAKSYYQKTNVVHYIEMSYDILKNQINNQTNKQQTD